MSLYDDGLDFSKPDPIITWSARCPHCRRDIFFPDCTKNPDYYKDMSEYRLKQLRQASTLIAKINAWCDENIGDNYTRASYRALYEELKRKFGTDKLD